MVNAIKNNTIDKPESPKIEKVVTIEKEEIDEDVFDARELLLEDDLEPVEEKVQKFEKKKEPENYNQYRQYMSWMP